MFTTAHTKNPIVTFMHMGKSANCINKMIYKYSYINHFSRYFAANGMSTVKLIPLLKTCQVEDHFMKII
jgi:hypothetical protein